MPEASVQPEASTVSTGQTFRYVGNYVYGYSGTFEATGSSADMFNFTTGSGIIKGEFTFNGQIRFVVGSSGGHSVFRLSLNGAVVGLYKADTAQMDQPNQLFQKVIIPPFTKVRVEVISGEVTDNELLTSSFAGRVYGAE